MNCGAFEENLYKSLLGYLKQLLQLEVADGRRVDSFDEIESVKLLNSAYYTFRMTPEKTFLTFDQNLFILDGRRCRLSTAFLGNLPRSPSTPMRVYHLYAVPKAQQKWTLASIAHICTWS